MFEPFLQKIDQQVALTDHERQIFSEYLTMKKIRKKQHQLREGEVCRHTVFVSSGLLRSFTTDEKGTEHVVQFAPEGWFVSDMYSLLTEEPATQNIDAIEDSELILLPKNAQDELIRRVPKFEHFLLLQIRGAYIALQRRITDMISLSSEEKYTKLLKTYPQIVLRVPQHMIASYLGLTPETLSRTRKNMSSR